MADDGKLTDAAAAKITRVEELAYELVVNQVMTKNLVCLDPEESMLSALDKFRVNRISGAPVLKDDRLVGILSTEDMIRSLRDGRVDRNVEEYMTSDVITVRDTDPVVEALKTFRKLKVGRLPAVNLKAS